MRMKDYFILPVAPNPNAPGLADDWKAGAHAINCHDELVAELKSLRDRYYEVLLVTGVGHEYAAAAIAAADAILNKAKGN